MAITLPDVGGSKDAWGAIVNTALTSIDTDVTAAEADIDALQATVAGLQADASRIASTSPRPAAATAGVGATHLDTATGFLSYVASIGGTATWVPWPGTPIAILRQTVAQSIPHNTVTAITFGTADYDRLNGWASGTPSRYTAPVAGWYEFTGGVAYASNATGARAAHLTKNGAGTQIDGSGAYLVSTASPVVTTRTTPTLLTAGQYVQLTTFQSSGGALNTDVSQAPYTATLHVKYLGSA